jgi:hypothetical protein
MIAEIAALPPMGGCLGELYLPRLRHPVSALLDGFNRDPSSRCYGGEFWRTSARQPKRSCENALIAAGSVDVVGDTTHLG